MKRISAVFAAGVILFLFSCNNNGNQKDETKAKDTTATTKVAEPAFTPFKVFMVQVTVKNFNKWNAVHLAHDSLRKAYGISQYVLGRGLSDSNMIIVIEKITDVQKTKEYTELPKLKEAMKKAGIIGPPTFSYVDVVRNDDTPIDYKDRVMVVHRVKDFDAWLKVYDREGKMTRATNGLVDRGLGRSVDDSNMVYVVFAVTDMAKARARVVSEELKKLMTEAGVEGPPQIHYYRLVN